MSHNSDVEMELRLVCSDGHSFTIDATPTSPEGSAWTTVNDCFAEGSVRAVRFGDRQVSREATFEEEGVEDGATLCVDLLPKTPQSPALGRSWVAGLLARLEHLETPTWA